MSATTIQHVLRVRASLLMPLYLVGHLLLDWATFIPAFSPLGITPWNPTTGLLFGLVLLRGAAWMPMLALAPLASDIIVRQVELSLAIAVAEVMLVGAFYAAGIHWLGRVRPRFGVALETVRDLALLAGVATVTTAAVAVAYVGVLVAAGLLPAADFTSSALRYWIGETIGILVMTPFVLLAATFSRRPRLTAQGILQALAILGAIVAVLWIGARYQTQLFYVLFLPIVWVAVTSGLEGVSAALVAVQVGIMTSLHLGRQDAVGVTEFQAMLLVLVCAGLTIGMLVRERQAGEARLRMQQDQIARAVRLASIDRFTTAMAHEINQPLTAIGNYARAVVRALGQGEPDLSLARQASEKVVAQVTRAAEVVRRLRNLITLGRAELGVQRIADIVDESLDLVRPDLRREGVRVEVEIARGADLVKADVLQIEQVLTNLFRNAIEAMHERPPGARVLSIDVRPSRPGEVVVQVSDSGPGFPAGFRLAPDLPSPTSKAHGLGIGLSLSATIVEAHGGKLTVSEAGRPGTVTFTLETANGEANGPQDRALAR